MQFQTMTRTKSAYIHIPFCLSKCNYCSFISFNKLDKRTGYLYSILKEIDYYYKGEQLDTIYFGGGTPSLFAADELNKILSRFNYSDSTEITIEVNPDSAMNLEGYKNIGFNRISIGSQSFNDEILKQIGRRHNSAQIIKTVQYAKQVGFNNISLDLIYGLPNQTLRLFEYDLNQILQLGIQHVSLYGLKIEEGCYFYEHLPENLPDDDIQADMYLRAIDILDDFNHYEISNFAKSGFESRHNLNYWQEGEYYGFGVAAHGFVDGLRYSNYCTLEEYMNAPTSHEYGKFITKQEKLEESIFLGFRISDGIDIEKLNKNFEIDFDSKYKEVISKYLNSGHILRTEKGYKLSDSGFLLSNIILADFLG